jgi:hypothetical protein
MDTDCSPEDDLSGIERRLAAWRPAAPDRGADAVLFAAGRASARSRRTAWIVAAGFAVAAVALGVWGGLERSARLELAQQLREAPHMPAPPDVRPSPEERPPPGDYLTARDLILERGVDAWVHRARVDASPSASGPLAPTTLGAWRRDRLLDP